MSTYHCYRTRTNLLSECGPYVTNATSIAEFEFSSIEDEDVLVTPSSTMPATECMSSQESFYYPEDSEDTVPSSSSDDSFCLSPIVPQNPMLSMSPISLSACQDIPNRQEEVQPQWLWRVLRTHPVWSIFRRLDSIAGEFKCLSAYSAGTPWLPAHTADAIVQDIETLTSYWNSKQNMDPMDKAMKRLCDDRVFSLRHHLGSVIDVYRIMKDDLQPLPAHTIHPSDNAIKKEDKSEIIDNPDQRAQELARVLLESNAEIASRHSTSSQSQSPPPSTTIRRARRNYSPHINNILMTYFLHHRGDLPSPADKLILCKQTGLKKEQLNTWIQNSRRRRLDDLRDYYVLHEKDPHIVYDYNSYMAVKKMCKNLARKGKVSRRRSTTIQ